FLGDLQVAEISFRELDLRGEFFGDRHRGVVRVLIVDGREVFVELVSEANNVFLGRLDPLRKKTTHSGDSSDVEIAGAMLGGDARTTPFAAMLGPAVCAVETGSALVARVLVAMLGKHELHRFRGDVQRFSNC